MLVYFVATACRASSTEPTQTAIQKGGDNEMISLMAKQILNNNRIYDKHDCVTIITTHHASERTNLEAHHNIHTLLSNMVG